MSGGRDYRGDVPAATVGPSIHDLYVALDGGPDSSQPARRRRRPFIAGRAIRIMVVVLAFAAGVAVDAAVFHLGDRPRAAGVVIGDQVIRQRTPQRTLTHPPPSPPFVSLSWGAAVLVDPSASLQSISCPTDRFCAAVDTQGQASQYVDGVWSSPRRIDGDTAINSISCTDMSFCLAVDERGNALRYDGTKWSAPLRIDKTTFPELTTVSCSSRSFCAAMDGDGNGLTYNGMAWSPPQQVDPQGWSPVSHDVPAVACPTDGFCVGVDPQDSVLFYTTGSWQTAAPPTVSGPQPGSKYDNAISCSSTTFCAASQNPGEMLTYNGTQWSAPVPADPSNYLASISCVSSAFCVAADSLLPAGYSNDTADGNGEVVTYNGTSWSAPQQTGIPGIVSAISCATTAFCAVIDKSGHAVVGVTQPRAQTNPARNRTSP